MTSITDTLNDPSMHTRCLVGVRDAKLEAGLQVAPGRHETGARQRRKATDPNRVHRETLDAVELEREDGRDLSAAAACGGSGSGTDASRR
jgi:hypothetical protein